MYYDQITFQSNSTVLAPAITQIYRKVSRRTAFCLRYFINFEVCGSLNWSVAFTPSVTCLKDQKSHLCEIPTKRLALNFYFHKHCI